MFAASAVRIERVEVSGRHRYAGAAVAQIVGARVGLAGRQFDGAPATPAAVVAAIGLQIAEPVTQGFEEAPHPRRVEAGRIT